MTATHNPSLPFERIVVGLWRLADWHRSADESADWAESCLELGLSSFDLADIYGDYRCEELFGDALRSRPGLRNRVKLATKCGIRLPSPQRPDVGLHHYDTSAEHIVRSAERSLQNLGTDHVDLLMIHRPDPLMDPDEIAEAVTGLREAGKVLRFGVSNFTPSQMSMISSRLDEPLATNQIEASVVCLDPFLDGTVDACMEHGIQPMAWSPLGGGALFDERDERAVRVRDALAAVAATHGDASIDTVAFAFLLRHPARLIPITGSGRLERVRDANAALDLKLSREEWFQIWTASTGTSLP